MQLNLPFSTCLNIEKIIEMIRKQHDKVWLCSSSEGHIRTSIHNFGIYDDMQGLFKFIDTDNVSNYNLGENNDYITLHITRGWINSYYKIYGINDVEKSLLVEFLGKIVCDGA